MEKLNELSLTSTSSFSDSLYTAFCWTRLTTGTGPVPMPRKWSGTRIHLQWPLISLLWGKLRRQQSRLSQKTYIAAILVLHTHTVHMHARCTGLMSIADESFTTKRLCTQHVAHYNNNETKPCCYGKQPCNRLLPNENNSTSQRKIPHWSGWKNGPGTKLVLPITPAVLCGSHTASTSCQGCTSTSLFKVMNLPSNGFRA